MNEEQQTPNKQQVNVELPSAFGGKRIQQLDIQGSRTSPIADFNWYLLNQLGIPARVPDVLADMLLWLAACTFIGSVGKQLIQLPLVPAIASIVLAIAVVLCVYILKIATTPSIRWSLVYRWFLVCLGVYLGVR
jgi:hypothetical protein